MGVPLKNGGHILFPEEAVFLIEHHNAYATEEGRLLTLHGAYRILGECGIPMYKFRAYSALRQAGFAVLRPNRSFVHSLQLHEKPLKHPSKSLSPSSHSYPHDLLNAFPTLTRSHMFMPQLHLNKNVVPVHDLDGVVLNPCAYQLSGKPFHNFRLQMRPASWPWFDHIRQSASSWAQFASFRSQILSHMKPVPNFGVSRCRYDFDVFLTDRFAHRRPPTPAFLVICFESRGGAMSCSYVHRCARENALVLSIYDSGHICFTEISGKPIDLNQYLKDLQARSMK